MSTLQKHVSGVAVDPKLGKKEPGRKAPKVPDVVWYDTEFMVLHDKPRKSCYRAVLNNGDQQLMVGSDLWVLKTLFPDGEPAEGTKIKVRIGVPK